MLVARADGALGWDVVTGLLRPGLTAPTWVNETIYGFSFREAGWRIVSRRRS
jgi:hypothetical protein